MDGSIEHKIYAAGFGIVEDSADDELLNLVMFQRADSKPGSVPELLLTVEGQAEDIFDVAPNGDWPRIARRGADVAARFDASWLRSARPGKARIARRWRPKRRMA